MIYRDKNAKGNLADFWAETLRKGLNCDCYYNDCVISHLGLAHCGTFWPDAAQAVPFFDKQMASVFKMFSKSDLICLFFDFNKA